MILRRSLALPVLTLLAACAGTPTAERAAQATVPAAPVAPVAEIRPHPVASPHGTRIDNYYWLRDDKREAPDLLAYLNAENAYLDARLARTKAAQDLLFKELVARLKPDDASVPALDDGYWYYTRYEEGKEYAIYARKRTLDGPEQVMLDGNALAQGQSFFAVDSTAVTPDGRILAYTVDTVGRRQWTLRFKNLDTGETYSEQVANVEGSVAWANDNRTVLYVAKDPVTLLGSTVRKHVLGTDPALDPLVYEEQDKSYYVEVFRSRSDRFLNIYLSSTLTTEQRIADADDAQLAFSTILPRERDHEYFAEDLGDRLLIRSNWRAKNFRIVEVPLAHAADRSAWRDVIAHRADAFVDGFDTFDTHLAVAERSGGLRRIRLKRWSDGVESVIAADEPAYTATIDNNPEQHSSSLRYVYTSLTTPATTYDYDLASGSKVLRKREPVLGDFDPANYVTEFLHASARDGTKVPVSIVYRKGFVRDGSAPLLQYGYGSYGSSTDPAFSSPNLSLLDRGFVYAIAHIRGGQELGRQWYEDGKLLKKRNTFTDFVDVTDFLVRERYAAKDKVFARGRSAGGLLMGAIANIAPDRYRGIVAEVPFVDVVTTMLDDTIPLTSNEYDEWGNPKDKAYYDYMLSYSPYDNVARQAYPALLVTTGLWDSQVQYYEPAKWVAKLRVYNSGDAPVLLRTNMDAGHGGKSGRFRRYEEVALSWAFILDLAGVAVQPLSGGTD
jgi:oligopeptidase B